MNPKQDNQMPSKNKIFDVARPGKTPASPTSRPVVNDKPSVKDFDFSESSSDSSKAFGMSGFGGGSQIAVNDSPSQKSGAPELPDNAASGDMPDDSAGFDQSRLSQIQNELGSPSDSKNKSTDFKPDNFETSNLPENDDTNQETPGSDDTSEEEQDQDAENNLFQDQDDDQDMNDEQNVSDRSVDRESRKASERSKSARESSKDKENKAREPRQLSEPDYKKSNPEPASDQYTPAMSGQMVVSQHTGHGTLWAELFAFLAILLLLAGILNLLLDAGIIALEGIPHTDIFTDNL